MGDKTLSYHKKNLPPPPKGATFWELFDYIWDNGVGQETSENGEPVAWSAAKLESALDHQIDVRSIENWRSRKYMPTRENIRKLTWMISGGDQDLRQAWSEALIAEWRAEKLRNREADEQSVEDKHPEPPSAITEEASRSRFAMPVAIAMALCAGGAALWYIFGTAQAASVQNIRICDAPYFDKQTKDCSQHVSVFVEPINEVFLSFDFENLGHGEPFERWWIRNGERVTGRTSFNDEAWQGYTYWRPEGGLPFGQYVVRIVVEGTVFTQTFQIQKEAFNVEN